MMQAPIHEELVVTPGNMSLRAMREIARGEPRLRLADGWRAPVEESVDAVQRQLESGRVCYGVNTGFGKLAGTRIAREQLTELQFSIVRSHAAGTGPLLDDSIVRLVLALKAASLARGYSAVRAVVIDRLLEFFNASLYPCIPIQGSVGASGDLAPLAHLSLPLIGEGEVRFGGQVMPAGRATAEAEIEPLTLAPKEGLALLNGTQVSTALALHGLFLAEDLLTASLLTGAISVEATLGSRVPFDASIHRVRGHSAQMEVAAAYRAILGQSEIGESHRNCDRVQDPYSLRCQPQVVGACLQQLWHAAHVLGVEANAVSDNPLVFAETGEVLSGGNFHAEPVAMAADAIAIAIAELGAIAERRIALLMDSSLSQLPPFLVKESGVNSGFMLAQVTAAALASENKSLAHPASVDSLPTSANQEDHVSMATFAARRLMTMAENTRGILAIELLAAAQGLDFRRPLKSSSVLEAAHSLLRERVPFYDRDRRFSPDIEAAREVVLGRPFLQLAPLQLFGAGSSSQDPTFANRT